MERCVKYRDIEKERCVDWDRYGEREMCGEMCGKRERDQWERDTKWEREIRVRQKEVFLD